MYFCKYMNIYHVMQINMCTKVKYVLGVELSGEGVLETELGTWD